MADTVSDVALSTTAWTDLYSSTSIAVGTALIIQNKSGMADGRSNALSPDDSAPGVIIYKKATDPGAANYDGFVLRGLESIAIPAGETGVWARAISGPALVHVDEA